MFALTPLSRVVTGVVTWSALVARDAW